MQIQNLLIRGDNNLLQESGDLDGQIVHDFETLAASLHEYQTEHLDKKVKGRSNHYEKWSAENRLKIQYANRIACLARMAAENMKDVFTEDEFMAMTAAEKQAEAVRYARILISRVGPYDVKTVYVERQSVHPEDWYLWTVAAYHETKHTWSVWTMNLATGGLNGGFYDIPDMSGCNKAIARKKHAIEEKTKPSDDEIRRAEQCLADNGVDPVAAKDIMKELGPILTGFEFYPNKESED